MTSKKPTLLSSSLAAGAAAIALGIFAAVAYFTVRPAPEGGALPPVSLYRDIDPEIPGLKASVGRDDIPALWDPQFSTAREATWADDEPVIGLAINGEAKAYPLALLNSHEIANDVVGGIPVAVTW